VSPRTVLVLGGVRAGKSTFAVARARAHGGRVAFVATAEAGDDEMAARIARHRVERPPAWRTVEVPLALVSALTALEGEADVVVVDCLNLWVANLLDKRPELSDSDLLAEAAQLEAAARRPRFSLILVSNEVGWGIHPATELGRRFRDALGLVNQAVARAADEVVLMVAGCPLVVKPADAHASPEGGRLR
jgi:adenosylcobinamide kinase/adenosylcobinamide-phosphate guanylyltransferase